MSLRGLEEESAEPPEPGGTPGRPPLRGPEPEVEPGSAAGVAQLDVDVVEGVAGLSRVFIVATALVGLGLRVLLLVSTSSIGRPDSDEVIAGLMARHIGSDGYPLFFWGQSYGGTPTLGLVGLSLRVFGSSVVAMRIPGVILACACSVLVWRLATRLLSRRGAQLAGLLSWIGGPPAVYFSVREHLFYVPTVFFGLLAGLFAFRVRERRRAREWVGLGVASALGIWCMPTIAYFALPALFVLAAPAVEARRARRRSGPAAGGPSGAPVVHLARWTAGVLLVVIAGVSALVWLTRGTPKAWSEAHFDYLASLRFFFTDGLPGLLGFREIFTYRWIFGGVGVVLYLLVLVVLAFGLAQAVRRRAWDAVGLLCYPLLFACFPKATEQPNMRYLFFAVPFVAVVVARVAGARRATAYVAVVVALALTLVSLQRLYVVSEVDRSTRVGLVGDLDQAMAVLDEEHASAVYADYWISYRLDFESTERIVATPPFREGRYPPYADVVDRDPNPAWVVRTGDEHDALLESLSQLGVDWRERPAGEFVVVIPDRPVRPAELGDPASSRI